MNNLIDPLHRIFNKSIENSVFITRLKISYIVQNKVDRRKIEHYRPITIFNAFSKIFVRKISEKLYNRYTSKITGNQHGVTKDL